MSGRTRGLLFGLGVVLGLAGVGAFLLARQGTAGFLIMPASPGSHGDAKVVYLSPVTAADLWQNSPDGQNPRRLTETGGRVFDFGVSPDGRKIVYSSRNALNGLDLWLLPSSGGSPRRLLECGADQCSGAVFAPDGSRIAYSRRVKADNPAGSIPGLGRIWLLTVQNTVTKPLYGDAAINGQDVSWSPDGAALALYDPLAGAIRVHRLNGGQDLVLPVSLEKSGGWSMDSKKLVFADYALGQERPIGVLSEIDLATGKVIPAFTDLDLVDFDSPVFDPSGSWMAVAGQAVGEGSARSIRVVRVDGSKILRVTNDPLAIQAAYHWDFSGKRLVYQEYRPENSESKPSIYVWNLQTQAVQLVAQDAALPAWVR